MKYKRLRSRRFWLTVGCITLLTGLSGFAFWYQGTFEVLRRDNVLHADGSAVIAVMNFSAPFTLDPMPKGWRHRRFWTRTPMKITVVEKDGVRALRCSTDDSASMLVRYVDIDLTRYQVLEWSWFVEQGISSAIDERTTPGDDHPARLFLRFSTTSGGQKAMEIIWGNKFLVKGDWKLLGDFPHYVANGGDSEIGRWHDESVNLLSLYHHVWGADESPRLTEIAVFCDSDETGGTTTAYFTNVRLLL